MAKYTAEDRRNLAEKGHALPDGSFPIADTEDLKSAIRNWALGKHPDTAKKHIMRRAKALDAEAVIPDKWKVAAAEHSDDVDNFLLHFGVKGMRWGRTTKGPTASREQRKADRKEQRKINRLGPAYVKSAFTGNIHGHELTKFQQANRVAVTGYLAAATAGAAYVGVKYGPATVNTVKLVSNAAKSKAAADGAKFAAKTLGDLGKSLPYAKIAQGAYKVTSLK